MSGPLSVVFVIQDLRTGGAERHAATLLVGLARRGHRSAVVCVESLGPMADGLAAAGVDVVDLGLGTGWKWRMTASRDVLTDALARLTPDVVMTSGYSAEVLSRLALRGRPDIALLSWKHNIGHLGGIGVRDRVTERLLGHHVTRYLAVSHTQLGYLRGYLRLDPARIVVLRNAIALPAAGPDERATVRSELRLAADDVALGCVAVLRPEKDHTTLLTAFAALPAVPRAVLVLVGDGPARSGLEALAARLGVADRVRFLGQRPDAQRLLAAFDVAVLSSQTIENLPYSVLEAMAAGLPVVATAVGALPELVDDGRTGWLVPPRSPRVLTERLRRVVEDRPAREAMGTAARERVRTCFGLTQQVSDVERELEEVVRDGREQD